ncbi:MAG: apolipoprotein N-acyltransferase [Acidimicrobiia bacterium]
MPVVEPEGDTSRRRRNIVPRSPAWWARLGAAVASGLLLASTYAPFDVGLLALVALIPLLWVWHDAGPGRAAGFGFAAGIVFFGTTLSWTSNVGFVAAIALAIVLGAFWALAGAIIGGLGRLTVRSPWITAATWVVIEAARGRFPLGGMPWAEAGVALHDVSPARALATFGGVPLVSFLVVALNALLLDAVLAGRAQARRSLAAAGAGILLVVIVAGLAVAGRYEPRPHGEVRYALIQGNDQNRRLTQAEVDSDFLTNKHLALADDLAGDYDLIVFPESAFETDPEADPSLHQRIVEIAREHDSAVLVNALTDGAEGKRFNTNRLYSPTGRLVGSYSKQHLVPFGEYVPWGGWPRDAIPALATQVPTDLTPGDGTVVLDAKSHRLGTVICFESAFSPLVRSSVRAGADLLVVTTNNRSYRRSALSAQHLATSQMRAAETARPVLHAAVSGITGVVDSSGRVIRENPLFQNAVVEGRITTMTGDTPYVRHGEWVVWGSAILLLGAVITGLTRRTLRGRNPVTAVPVEEQSVSVS